MKKWTTPLTVELGIEETAHNVFGFYGDGGYIGDGIISGHLSFTKPEDPSQPSQPSQPVGPEDVNS